MFPLLACASAILSSPPVFQVQQDQGRWAIVSPEGQRWWSVAACCVNQGLSEEQYDPANHGYAAYRLFESTEAWAVDTLKSLRSWGFNSLGGWSDAESTAEFGGDARLPFFVVLHLGAYDRAPWNDMFAPQFTRAVEDAAATEIAKVRNDPLLVGYFSDNELGWWDDTLFLHYMAMPASAPGKQRWARVLREAYRGDFCALQGDWVTNASSFDDLVEAESMQLRPGSGGMRAVNAWTRTLASHYYRTVRRAIRAHDPERLILGDRYPQFWELPVVEASKGYIDVVSTNYGADWLDGSLNRFFLDTLHEITGKPVIIGEFYMNAMENRSGNRNSIKAFPIVQTQAERERATARNLRELAERPYVVGAHWFQFYDHPAKGRAGDGEDNNMGLVDTDGQAYEGLVEIFRRFDWAATRPIEPQDSARIPRAIRDPLEGLRHWPRAQGWIKPSNAAAFGDLYVCADDSAVYLGWICSDYIDERLYVGGALPDEDRPRLSLTLNRRAFEVRWGGKEKPAAVSPKGISIAEWPGLKHQLVMRVPWSALGGRPRSVRISATMTQHSRAATMRWASTVEVGR